MQGLMATPRAASRPLTAAILGATGAVGKEVVSQLSRRSEWGKIIVLNRREVAYLEGKVDQLVVPMEEGAVGGALEIACVRNLGGIDALFVTMGVGAPSKVSEAVLKRVDVDLPYACGRGAKTAGVRHVTILSAVGADVKAKSDGGGFLGLLPATRAGGGFYNHCKGLVEQHLAELQFEAGVTSFRPAALIGTPHTPKFIEIASPLLDAVVPAKYKSSNIDNLAAAMVSDAEARLGERAAASGGVAGELRVMEGAPLHALYSSVLFPHGTGMKP